MAYLAPGVYLKYPPGGPLTIRAASTSTAVFIGPTVIGRTISGSTVTPVHLTSITDFADQFSTKGCRYGAVSLPTKQNSVLNDQMGQAVSGFFLNGGTNAYIVSTSATAEVKAKIVMTLKSGATKVRYNVEAVSAGKWGNDISIDARTSSLGTGFCDIDIHLTLAGDSGDVVTTERFVGINMNEVISRVASTLVTIVPGPNSGGAELDTDVATDTEAYALTGGVDALATVSSDFAAIFGALKDVDDISLIVLPGLDWPTHKPPYENAISHCQTMNDRMVLIQLKDDVTDFANVSVPLEKSASVYYPAADIAMPIPGGGTKTVTAVGVTGHVAGIFARTDADKGAWSAPAGLHASIRGITRLTQNISQAKQEQINPNNINALRYIEGIPVIWGARTRDKAGIYEYVPVMRTAFLIGDSLRTALNKVVFAKNTEVLWKNVKGSVSAFMGDLFTQGAFQGATPSQSFDVYCGLGESMSQSEIDGGLLRVTVRFKPAKVAEFIEISVEQKFETAA